MLYKDHWDMPYSLAQLENQILTHIHFEDDNKFGALLRQKHSVEFIETSDAVRNIGNIIKRSKRKIQ